MKLQGKNGIQTMEAQNNYECIISRGDPMFQTSVDGSVKFIETQ